MTFIGAASKAKDHPLRRTKLNIAIYASAGVLAAIALVATMLRQQTGTAQLLETAFGIMVLSNFFCAAVEFRKLATRRSR